MLTTVVTDSHPLPSRWSDMLSNTNELLLQRNGEPVAVLVTFDHFMALKKQTNTKKEAVPIDKQAQLDEQMKAAALALLDDYTNDSELTIFTTSLADEAFYDYDE